MIRLPDIYDLRVEGDEFSVWRFECPLEWTRIKILDKILAYFGLPCGATVAVNAWSFNGKPWLHGSIARPDRLPSYEDLCMLKHEVFGAFGFAYQSFESVDNHVNIHPNCLHLFGPMDASDWPGPRFTEGTI